MPCVGGGTFSIEVNRAVHRRTSSYQDITVYDTKAFGKCLVLDGLIQSSEADHRVYDRAALRNLSPRDDRILVLGGGDGYVAATALEMNPSLRVTIVELDPAVVEVSREFLEQGVFDDPRVTFVIEDAVDFLRHAPEKTYDGVVCDLTDFPLGQGDDGFQLFYSDIFSLVEGVMKTGAWIAVYSGSKGATDSGGALVTDILAGMLARHFAGLENAEILVPCFGEGSCFIHGRLADPKQPEVVERTRGVRKKAFRTPGTDRSLAAGGVAEVSPSKRRLRRKRSPGKQ